MTAPVLPPMPFGCVLKPSQTGQHYLPITAGPGSGTTSIPLPVGVSMARITWNGSTVLTPRLVRPGVTQLVLVNLAGAPTPVTMRSVLLDLAVDEPGTVLRLYSSPDLSSPELPWIRAAVWVTPAPTST